ncbi:type VI secretion system-associated FHA domain protein TagH [Erwinia sp. 198]|uniref:type VI secretion system-associated FHA domain protein TagH n=1 Tax=Erwinia sp. 198 TaxID=2022746 RepID=UPI000F67B6D5|nr:type VI secretion system-associated FHA domain protein TagH [Erwinia sp. 198]RRZ88096.1 type VI secretion system-associated FHA domain protein TagH [Erwinia sp. 198]
MRFTIIATKAGQQPPQSSCDFLPPGGTIGRGADNNLVLPDDDRTISRLQAIVHITADGECRITNRGNVTLVHLNDIPLERGRQVDLQDGDILSIDEYRLQVSELNVTAQPAARPAPVARPAAPSQESAPAAIPSEIWDSLAQEFSISDSLSSRSRPAPTGSDPLTEKAQDRNPVDPLAQFADKPAPQLDRRDRTPDSLFSSESLFDRQSIFDDSTPGTLTPQQQQDKKQQLDPMALFGSGNGTPADGDDPLGLMMGNAVPLTPMDGPQQKRPQTAFAPPSPKALDSHTQTTGSSTRNPQAADDLSKSPLFDTNPQAADDLSRSPLFDADPQAAGDLSRSPLFDADPQAADDLSRSPLFDADPQAAGDLSKSPLFDADPQAADDLSKSPLFGENAQAADDLSRSSLFAENPASDADFNEPTTAVRPPQQDYSGITLPTPQAVARSTTPPPKGRLRIDPVANTASQQHSASGDGQRLDGELLEALIGGMGLNDLQPTPRFDRDSMQELGQMLSMFSQGTVALLSSRSILKRGVKAEMTVILDEANNPFKLLPSGKSVLMQMFGSRMPGFMPPKQSVRDALVDLQAHQLGMIAGIRAIIASMLQSFNPQQLEEEAREEGAISRLSLPNSRKAALWEHFAKRYGETAGEIEDDFHTLFGEAFLHAYDMEVNQYKDSQIRSEE